MNNRKQAPADRLASIALAALLSAGVAACGDDLTGPDAGPPEFASADGINGGLMYDLFWAQQTGFDQADPNLAIFAASSNFFRCKQCHGWDGLGSQGAYASRAPKTSRPNVSALNLRTIAAQESPQQLFDALERSSGRRGLEADLASYDPATNPTVGDLMPDYGEILTDAQIWDLVRYLKVEALDTSELYDITIVGAYPSGVVTYSNIGEGGDAARGHELFQSTCAFCHGFDGAEILVDGGSYTVGRHLRAKPYEDQHKIKFGQPGTSMISILTDLDDIKSLYKALTDTARYPDN